MSLGWISRGFVARLSGVGPARFEGEWGTGSLSRSAAVERGRSVEGSVQSSVLEVWSRFKVVVLAVAGRLR